MIVYVAAGSRLIRVSASKSMAERAGSKFRQPALRSTAESKALSMTSPMAILTFTRCPGVTGLEQVSTVEMPLNPLRSKSGSGRKRLEALRFWMVTGLPSGSRAMFSPSIKRPNTSLYGSSCSNSLEAKTY